MTSQHSRWILGGGLASGKSEVRQALAERGMVTIDADTVGHVVLEAEGPAFGKVAARWPEVVIDGRIDRKVLAGIVFSDQDQLDELERITHPYIFDTIRRRVEEITGPVVVEMPIVSNGFRSGWRWAVVDCRRDLKVRRAVARGLDEADALARLEAQPTREEWLSMADLVVPNHGSLEELRSAVDRLFEHL